MTLIDGYVLLGVPIKVNGLFLLVLGRFCYRIRLRILVGGYLGV